MKKEILIVSRAMELGGVERALLGLLNSIDKTKYDVDLFLYQYRGDLMSSLPKDINLLPENKKYRELDTPIGLTIKRGNIDVALGRLESKLRARRYVKKHFPGTDNQVEITYSHKYTSKFMPKISEKEYDLAISFLAPHYNTLRKVKAKKKIAWIHTDYSFVNVDVKSELPMWDGFDKIASISEDVTNAFFKKFPSLKDKIILVENIISPVSIQQQAEMFDVKNEMPDDGFVKLLSVGRFAYQKNFENIPEICRLIIEKGYKVKWYIVGYSNAQSDIDKVRNKINEFGMEESVIILGKKDNPYPYIKECDIYVQPSRYEGKAVTVREAQILCKPVIITDYPTAHSQVNDGFDGIIVPLNNEGCAEGIVKCIDDKEQQKKLIANCTATDYSNSSEVEKIYKVME